MDGALTHGEMGCRHLEEEEKAAAVSTWRRQKAHWVVEKLDYGQLGLLFTF